MQTRNKENHEKQQKTLHRSTRKLNNEVSPLSFLRTYKGGKLPLPLPAISIHRLYNLNNSTYSFIKCTSMPARLWNKSMASTISNLKFSMTLSNGIFEVSLSRTVFKAAARSRLNRQKLQPVIEMRRDKASWCSHSQKRVSYIDCTYSNGGQFSRHATHRHWNE